MKRARIATLVAVVVALALTAISSGQTWVFVTPTVGAEPLPLTGSDLSAALPAIALGTGGIALALFFARRLLIYVVGSLLVVLAVVQSIVTVQAMSPDNPAVHHAIESATGIAGIAPASMTPQWTWPSLVLVAAGIAILAALFAIATVHRWPQAKRRGDRYDMRSGSLAWDALDQGDDPTVGDDDRAPRTD